MQLTSASASGKANTSGVRTGRISTCTVLAPVVSLVCPHFGQSSVAGLSPIGTVFFRRAMTSLLPGCARRERRGLFGKAIAPRREEQEQTGPGRGRRRGHTSGKRP